MFDIRDPHHPREVAYFNPTAQLGKLAHLPGSEHASLSAGGAVPLTTDYCSSPPRFVGDELWVGCQDNGFMTLRFTNATYPLGGRTSAAEFAYAGRSPSDVLAVCLVLVFGLSLASLMRPPIRQ